MAKRRAFGLLQRHTDTAHWHRGLCKRPSLPITPSSCPDRSPASRPNPPDSLSLCVQVSVQFGAFHYARRTLESRNLSTGHQPTLSLGQFYLAGAFAGLTNTFLSTPIEHIRIRLQTQPHAASARLYAGPWDCARQLQRRAGVGYGIYRGATVTALREAQAYGVWFLTFEALMNADARRTNTARTDIATWKVALYGGLAGEGLWIASYPFDVIKSKMQTDGFGARAASVVATAGAKQDPAVQEQRYPNMRAAFRETWRTEGVRGFWKGIGPTLLRAMPVSAGTFAV
jgi:solute carrier family 25 (mitochondrial carnitine/acylcarnitine transporter), member 20/29